MLAPFLLMKLERISGCKVNLLLNILGKRADGFHELETLMHPVPVHDRITLETIPGGVELTCSDPTLPVDSTNLVCRAADEFLTVTDIKSGVRLHLDKQIPLAAGLGGGSGDAATTLLGLNDLFDCPLDRSGLHRLAAKLGSDVPFFLQAKPAMATGRGEIVEAMEWFPALRGVWILVIHPGFGIPTAWAYRSLSRFPAALNGPPGRAARLIRQLQTADLAAVGRDLYNSLESPALEKFPILRLYQDFLRAEGAVATLMSGSGSSTFALANSEAEVQGLREKFLHRFGPRAWTAAVALPAGTLAQA